MYLGEDSFFLSETLKSHLKSMSREITILDTGSGSGIQAETCLSLGFKNIVCVDTGDEEVKHLKKRFRAVKSDLFSKVKGKFDLIMFNPPYLPENKYDSKPDTTGGKIGDETIVSFLDKARNHLTKKGEIMLLLSSLTPRKRIEKIVESYYKKTVLAEKRFFFEKLEIWLIRKKVR
jgi:release factor glutamine methyltransferase